MKIGVIGKVISGQEAGKYILIKSDLDPPPDDWTSSYLLYFSPRPEFTGGARNGVFNDWCENIRQVIFMLGQHGITEADIEWLDENSH